jgi:uncharacterized UBP type Zn finger protein
MLTALQVLMHCEDFVSAFDETNEVFNCIDIAGFDENAQYKIVSDGNNAFIQTMKCFIKEYRNCTEKNFNPTKLLNLLGQNFYDYDNGKRQQDVHEFLLHLLNSLTFDFEKKT